MSRFPGYGSRITGGRRQAGIGVWGVGSWDDIGEWGDRDTERTVTAHNPEDTQGYWHRNRWDDKHAKWS